MSMIDLRRPVRSERVRGFQPPRRTVYVYVCPVTGRELRMRAGSFSGGRPVPGVGAVMCACCPVPVEYSPMR